MKKITLLMMLITMGIMSAQQTFTIDPWQQGGSAANFNFTIQQGDTVRWVWGNGSHDVASDDPDAPADFGNGMLINQPGFVYEYTFTDVAVIEVKCTPHPMTMFGTITVEEALSVEDKFAVNVNYYPNPVVEKMTLTSLYELDSYEIFSVLGQKVMSGVANGNVTEIDMNGLNNGVYLVTAVSGELKTTFKVIKK